MHDPDLYAAFRFASDLQGCPLDWLWPDRIPLGKLTLLIGDPGVGKSLLVADLAARVSTGRPWPAPPVAPDQPTTSSLDPAPRSHSDPATPRSLARSSCPFGVVLVAPEDSPDDTLLPRLTAAGADLGYICILHGASPQPILPLRQLLRSPADGLPVGPSPSAAPPCVALSLPDHLPALQETIRAVTSPRLVVLDPLHAVLSPAAHANPAVLAGLLTALADTAHMYNVALVAICHLSKTRSHRFIYRVRGSLALTAAARVVHLVSADPNQLDRRLLTTVKTIYGAPPPALAFQICPGPRLEWAPPGAASEAPISADNTRAAPTCAGHFPTDLRRNWPACHDLLDLSPEAHSALYDACAWLADYLAAGPRPATEVLAAARAAGFTGITLRRAKRLLNICSLKPAPATPWLWSTTAP